MKGVMSRRPRCIAKDEKNMYVARVLQVNKSAKELEEKQEQ